MRLKMMFLALSIFCVSSALAQSAHPTGPINPVRQKWTYIRIADWDSLWGNDGPTLEDTIYYHLPLKTPPDVNYAFLGDGYGPKGSAFGYVTPSTAAQAGQRKVFKIPELSMNDPKTYQTFFNWVTANFPAEHYVLSFWGHGGGSLLPMGTLGYDSTSGDQGLSVNQFGQITKYLAQKAGKKVSVVFLCTCLNGTLENAFALKDAAEFYVSGETTVGCGLEPFNILMKTQDLSSEQLANATIDSFDGAGNTTLDVVYSSIRLAAIPALAAETGKFGFALHQFASRNPGNSQLILDTASLADNMNFVAQPSIFSTYLDLYGLAGAIMNKISDPLVQTSAREIQRLIGMQVISRLVAHTPVGTNKQSHGISIVHPTSKFKTINLDYYKNQEFSVNTKWGDYISTLTSLNKFGGPLHKGLMAPRFPQGRK